MRVIRRGKASPSNEPVHGGEVLEKYERQHDGQHDANPTRAYEIAGQGVMRSPKSLRTANFLEIRGTASPLNEPVHGGEVLEKYERQHDGQHDANPTRAYEIAGQGVMRSPKSLRTANFLETRGTASPL